MNELFESTRTQEEDVKRLLRAIDLSKKCIPTANAFSVGALVFDEKGELLAEGYSREVGPRAHAEEIAIHRAYETGASLRGSTIYSSLEPCGERASSDKTCVERIIEAGLSKVVFALKEPPFFVSPSGAAQLEQHGIQLVELAELAPLVVDVNRHLFNQIL